MAYEYSTVDDLLVGDVPLDTDLDRQKFVDDAGDEINSKLGVLYELPLHPEAGTYTDLPEYVRLLLKRISNNLATGRMMLSVATVSERAQDDPLRLYALDLVKDGTNNLNLLSSGTVLIPGAVRVGGVAEPSKVPSIKNLDPDSGVETFYETFAGAPTREQSWLGPRCWY